MTLARVELPPKLIPIFDGEADTRGAYGGRGSAKTRSFAKMTAVRAYAWAKTGREGLILCGRQFMSSLADSSMEEIKAAIRSEPWLLSYFDIGEKYIRTIDGRVSYVFAGLDRNVSSVKSKSRILLCWVDEAEDVTEDAWIELIPTIREDGSELWVTWNPRLKASATNKRFRECAPDDRTKIAQINWRDNPWFPDRLNRTRLKDLKERPDSYSHIWEGEFATAMQGAYWAKELLAARAEGRICRVAKDPLMTLRAFADIGGTGARADAFCLWIAQFIGREIRVLDYYEAVGQPLGSHLAWMRGRGYTPSTTQVWLPHDGSANDRVFDVSYASAFRSAEYDVTVVPNQGKGAAMSRIEQARRLFPSMWFDQERCDAGISALGWYHEKRDAVRNVGLGPEHDWSSHAADAFGLLCIVHTPPDAEKEDKDEFQYRSEGSWMS
jgi:phage terminase large subunit